MEGTMNSKTTAASSLAIATVVLALAACAATPAAVTTTSDVAEVEERHSRLLVSDADSGTVAVFDADTAAELGALELDGSGNLYPMPSGRYALSVQTDGNQVQLIDAGAWAELHGDHDHYYATEPAVIHGQLEGPKPVHVTHLHGITTVYTDGDGTAHVLEAPFEDGLQPELLPTADPHHGVAYALDDGTLIASFSNDEGRANGIRVTDPDGDILAESAECVGLHGETELTDSIVFACESGLMSLSLDDWTINTIAYGIPGRAGTLVTNDERELAYGIVDGTTLATFDGTAITTTELPGDGVKLAIADNGDALVVLADGTVARVAPSGAVVASAPLVGEFDTSSDHSVPRPGILLDGERVYLSDPVNITVLVADANSLELIESIELDFTPKSFALVR